MGVHGVSDSDLVKGWNGIRPIPGMTADEAARVAEVFAQFDQARISIAVREAERHKRP